MSDGKCLYLTSLSEISICPNDTPNALHHTVSLLMSKTVGLSSGSSRTMSSLGRNLSRLTWDTMGQWWSVVTIIAHLGLQVGPGDVGNDDPVRPEEHVRSLAIVGKVLDVDSLLVNDEDVSSHAVSCVLECAEVQRLGSLLARAQTDQQHHQGGQHVRLADLGPGTHGQ